MAGGGAGFVPSIVPLAQEQQPPEGNNKDGSLTTHLSPIGVPHRHVLIPPATVLTAQAAIAVSNADFGAVEGITELTPSDTASVASSASFGSVVETEATTGRETKVGVFSNPWGVW